MKKAIFLLQLLLFGIAATAQNYERGLKLLEKAEILNEQKVWDSAYTSGKQSLGIFKNLKQDSLVAKAAIGLLYTTNNIKQEEQPYYFNLARRTTLKTRNPKLLAQFYYTQGRVYFENREMGEAQPYFLKADSVANQYNFLNETIVRAVMARSEISRITFTPEGVEMGHSLQLHALELAKKINSEELINDLYLRLADMNILINKPAEAIRFLDLAFQYYKGRNDRVERMARAYLVYMNYYYAVKDYDNAGKKLEEGIEYLSNKDNPDQLASLLTSYGSFFRKYRNNCGEALLQYEKAQKIYDAIQLSLSDRYMFLMEGMAICYAQINNYEKAYVFYKKAYEVKRDLVNKENNELTRELENKYQSNKKEQQIALLASQNQLAEEQKTNQRYLIFGILILMAVVGTFVFFQLRTRQKTNDKLKELDKAKSTFFSNISHELRTPLTLISGPLQDQVSSPNITQSERKNLQIAIRSSNRLKELIDQLLTISKLESKHYALQVQRSNLPQFLRAQAEAFFFSTSEKNITYTISIAKDEIVDWFDQDVVEKILYNLIGNAIKYTPEGGTINIVGFREKERYTIQVQNSGNFIEIEHQKKIFDRFYQTGAGNQGSGIGLSLTKELTGLHHGTIELMSVENGLTEFTVKIPTNKEAFQKDEIFLENIATSQSEDEIQKIGVPKKTGSAKEEVPILLIVDDNEDILDYVSSIFENNYVVYRAPNGKEGFAKALENIPDVVISDVMMPEEDGFLLTKRLKEHQLTSHIPIILLTAKSQVGSHVEGLEVGADSYVTKPFNPQLLRANVENLLENRRKLQKRFSRVIILKPQEISISSVDEQFLEKLQKVLDQHLTDSDFSAEIFSREMGVSRMQLHRKLKALTGQATTEFIRSQRLKLALNLLKAEKITVAEVGYAVGFNDPSYFTRCFKQEFGFAPSQYSK